MRAMDCADYIVDRAIRIGNPLTNLQLQKALYVFAAEYMRLDHPYPYGEDDILAWKYGPAIDDVYEEYKKYGSFPIEKVSEHRQFNPEMHIFQSHPYNISNIENEYQNMVDNHLEPFLRINIFKIVDFTHKQEFWKLHRESIYRYDNLAYPHCCINLDELTIDEFLEGF